MQQLEQEVKLEPSPGWLLPPLSGVLPGVQVEALPDMALETTYYDTADLRLAHHHLTLRFRRQTELGHGSPRPDARRTTEVWTVKLPSSSPDNTVLARTEVNWEGDAPGHSPGGRRGPSRRRATGRGLQSLDYEFEKVHPEAAHFVQAVALGRPLEPIAHLSSIRRRTGLRTSDGRPLAEIDEDTITGRDLLATQERLSRHGETPDVRFREVEVELAEGSALEVLDAVVKALEAAGARRSPGRSKLARVLAGGSAEVDLADLHPPAEPMARGLEVAMSDVLQEQARSCLNGLVEHDPAIRLDDPDPEHIHRSRVATRRFRTILREFAPLLAYTSDYGDGHAGLAGDVPNAAEAWLASLREELKWLGDILGSVRDGDVRLKSLEEHCGHLPAADSAAGDLLLAAAREERACGHEQLRDAMNKSRYLDLLRHLDALASGPTFRSPVPTELWALLSEPAATGMPALAHRQWRAIRRAVGRLGPQPADDALHHIRIQAKRLRYLSEVAAPVIRPPANRDAAALTAKAATDLQDILGNLHDASVTEDWLRRTAPVAAARSEPAEHVAVGLAAGQLVAVERETRQRSCAAWPAAWRRLNRKAHRTWAADAR
ncbi:MAG TPA: CYTH and CHAD domain-containing protein [Acidimicrobiales bacterium]|nr:CYTH and CHAD domain-containing protein [Acidimicrobiales bacterium]